jgi:chromosome segregation ATPase
MSPDGDVQEEVRKLRDEVGELKTTTRVTKHDVANLQQTMGFFNTRLDKIQDQIAREVKETRDGLSSEIRLVADRVAADTKLLSAEIAGITNTQSKSAGFYAGMIAAGSIALGIIGSLLMLLYNQLFGGHA